MDRSHAKLVLKGAVTALLVGTVVHFVDFGKAIAGLRECDPAWFVGSFATLLLSVVLQCLRWRTMLGRADIPLHKFAYFLFMGYFLNLIIPTQVGSDLVRSAAFGRKYGEVGLNVGLVVAQRVIGLVFLVLFAAVGAWFYRQALLAHLDLRLSAYLVSAGAVLLAAAGLAIWSFRDRLSRYPVVGALTSSLTDPAVLRAALLHSFLIQVVTSVSTWMLFRAVFPEPDFWQITLFGSIVQVALLLPLSVGGVGIRDVLNLALFSGIGNLPSDRIVTVSLLGYSSLVLLAAIGGAWMAFRWISSGKHPLQADPAEERVSDPH